MPKSITFGRGLPSCSVTSTFEGLRSRWITTQGGETGTSSAADSHEMLRKISAVRPEDVAETASPPGKSFQKLTLAAEEFPPRPSSFLGKRYAV